MREPSVDRCAVVLIDGDDLDLACHCMKPMLHDDRDRAFQNSLAAQPADFMPLRSPSRASAPVGRAMSITRRAVRHMHPHLQSDGAQRTHHRTQGQRASPTQLPMHHLGRQSTFTRDPPQSLFTCDIGQRFPKNGRIALALHDALVQVIHNCLRGTRTIKMACRSHLRVRHGGARWRHRGPHALSSGVRKDTRAGRRSCNDIGMTSQGKRPPAPKREVAGGAGWRTGLRRTITGGSGSPRTARRMTGRTVHSPPCPRAATEVIGPTQKRDANPGWHVRHQPGHRAQQCLPASMRKAVKCGRACSLRTWRRPTEELLIYGLLDINGGTRGSRLNSSPASCHNADRFPSQSTTRAREV